MYRPNLSLFLSLSLSLSFPPSRSLFLCLDLMATICFTCCCSFREQRVQAHMRAVRGRLLPLLFSVLFFLFLHTKERGGARRRRRSRTKGQTAERGLDQHADHHCCFLSFPHVCQLPVCQLQSMRRRGPRAGRPKPKLTVSSTAHMHKLQ